MAKTKKKKRKIPFNYCFPVSELKIAKEGKKSIKVAELRVCSNKKKMGLKIAES